MWLLSASPVGTTLWTTLLRCLLGEIGDKTWTLTLLFTAWCPWEGTRGRSTASRQAISALCCVTALVSHVLLVGTIPAAHWAAWQHRYWFLQLVAGLLLGVLCLRAYLGQPAWWSRSPEYSVRAEDMGVHDPLLLKDPEPQYNREAFIMPLPSGGADGQEPYGSVERSCTAASSAEGPDKASTCGPCATAFSLAVMYVCVFASEAEDKSWQELVDSGRQGPEVVVGAAVGMAAATLLAAGLGVVFWNQLQAHTVGVLVAFALACLSLVNLSQAAVHCDALETAVHAVPSLLGLTARLRKGH